MIPKRTWLAYPALMRKRLNRTHAAYQSTGYCQRCYMRLWRGKGFAPDLAYEGGWINRGLIQVPTHPQRPVDERLPRRAL